MTATRDRQILARRRRLAQRTRPEPRRPVREPVAVRIVRAWERYWGVG